MLAIVIFGFLIGRFAFNMNDANQAVTATETDTERRAMVDDDESMSEESGGNTAGIDVAQEAPADAPTNGTTDSAVASDSQSGVYTDYDPALLANANSGEVLLFFHATWCPTCRGLDKNINANIEDLPSDVTILQVNYDTATELKKKHGVVRQHTLVRVDAEGNTIETLTGLTNTLDQVLAQI